MIDLSILVCATDTRFFSFTPRVMSQLFSQRAELAHPERVEVLCLADARMIPIGTKRNWLARMASGRYAVFVDDDDRVDDEYVSAIVAATETDCDVIAFPAIVTLAGGPPRICQYSMDFTHDYNTATGYHRLPNHICAVKRNLILDTPFAPICMGEDADYARRLFPKIKSEAKIEKPLYFYDYDPVTSESRR